MRMVSRSNSLGASSSASTEDGGDPLDARVCCHDDLGMAKCGVWLFTGIVLWAAGIVILTVEYEHLHGEGLRCMPDLSDPSAPCVNVTRWCYFSSSPYTDYSPCNFMTILGTLAIALPLIGLGITWLFSLMLTALLDHLPASKQGLYQMIYTGVFALGLWLAAVVKFNTNNHEIKQMPYVPPEMAHVQYWRDVASGMAWASLILCVIQLACGAIMLFIRVRSLYYPGGEGSAPLSAPLWSVKRHVNAPMQPPPPIAMPVLHSNPTFSASGAAPEQHAGPRMGPRGIAAVLPGLATPPGGTPRAQASTTVFRDGPGAAGGRQGLATGADSGDHAA